MSSSASINRLEPWFIFLFAILLVSAGCPMAPMSPDDSMPDDSETPMDMSPTLPRPQTLDISIVGQGAVQQDPEDNLIRLTAIPELGWSFGGWTGTVVATNSSILIQPTSSTIVGVVFLFLDEDGDGVGDTVDACPGFDDAIDGDGDGRPDGCDDCPDDSSNTDTDGDQVCDSLDNCPNTANADQADTDQDGMGNVCDLCPADAANDADGDGVCGDEDNCPNVANTDQVNGDGDLLGDVCDTCPADANNDVDGDGICGDIDNCPSDSNSDQTDTDGDGTGDACDGT